MFKFFKKSMISCGRDLGVKNRWRGRKHNLLEVLKMKTRPWKNSVVHEVHKGPQRGNQSPGKHGRALPKKLSQEKRSKEEKRKAERAFGCTTE